MADNFTANFLAELKKRNKQLTYTKKDDEDDKKKEGSRASGSSSGTKITPSDSTTKKTATTATAKSSSDSFTQNFLSELERRSAPVVSDNAATRVLAPSYQDTTNHAKKNASGLKEYANDFMYGTERAAAALLGFGENVTDFVGSGFYKGAETVTSLGGLLPNRVSKFMGDAADSFLENSVTQDYEQSIRNRYNPSAIEEKVTGVGQSITQMLAAIGLGQIGGAAAGALSKTEKATKAANTAANVSKAAFGLNAAGGSENEAYREGATSGQAFLYGTLAGSLEMAIESVAGGIPMMGKGKVTEIVRKIVDNPVVNRVLDTVGEGGEEALSEWLTPYLKRAVYNPKAELASAEDIADSAILGMISSVVLQTGIELPAVVGNYRAFKQAQKDYRSSLDGIGSDYQVAATKTIEEGLSFPPETEAHRVAQEVMEKLSRDGSVSDYDLGRVVVATERTMRQQEAQAQPAVTDEETLQLARETVAAQQNVPQAASQTESVDTKAVPLNVMSMESPEVQAKLARKANTAKWTGYGDAGVKAFDEVVEKSGQTREAVRTVFQSAYETGLAGVELEHVKDSIVSDVQSAAYMAGREDYVAGLGKKASTNVSGKPGFDTKGLPKDVADWEVKAIDTMARELGVSVSMTDDDGYNGRITGSGVLLSTTFQREFDGKKVGLLFHGAHEIGVHRVLQLAPKEGRAFVNAMYRYLTKDAPATDATLAEKKQAHYGAHDVELSTADAMEEIAANAVIQLYGNDPKAYADAVERVLSGKDEQAKKGLAKFKEVLGEIVQKIRRAISKLTGRELQEAQRDLSEIEKLRDLLETAMKAAQARAKAAQAEQKNTAQTDGGMMSLKGESFQEDKYFARQMDKWDELEDGARIKVGVVQEGSALNQVGLPASGMYFDVGKIRKAMNDHDDHLTPTVLKGIPDLLNDPIVIAQYTGRDGSIKNTVNVYGNLFVGDTPVVVGIVMHLDRAGRNVISNIRTIHARSNFAKQITDESVLYLGEDKKRTRKWFHDCGNLNVPLGGTKFGLIRSITYEGNSVKENPKYSFKIDIDGMSDEAKEIIGNLKRQTMFSKYTREGKFVSFTSDRIEREIRKSVYYGDTDAARSHIVWMDPLDFIYATTTSSEMRDNLKSEAGALDLEQLRSEDQPIYLHVNMETGEIVGHEGRHRMLALRDAGAEKVAVIIYWSGTDNRDMQPIRYKRLTGQTFGGPTRGAGFTLTDALPLSARYADAARQLFSEVGGSVNFSFKENESVQYSLVEDEETLDFLNQQEWVTVYRAMYQDETGLYPPMGAIQGGKRVAPVEFRTWYQADEHPELIKFEVPARYLKGELNSKGQPRKSSRFLTEEEVEANRKVLYDSHKPNDVIRLSSGATIPYKDLKSKFELVKADGGTDVPAAYNPYFHTSLSALNDQFSTAYKRPGLVVVEGYIPKSELTSGYKALYAKDPVGETTWKSGVVATNLKGDKARKVYLSRWFRAERVVSDDEAAGMIAKVLEGENLRVPWNVVTPALRNALEQSGVDIDYDYVYAGTSFEDFQKSGERFSLKEENGTTTVTDKNGDVVAETREDGSTMFSLKTYEDDGRTYLHNWLNKKVQSNAITREEADDITRQMDEFYDICQKFTDKYGTFGTWSSAEVVKGADGKPAFSVVKANGEYAMNLDFSLVCKKRRTLDAVFREMINRGTMDNVELGEEQIAKINAIIRDSGFETACALCFVDSKRYRQALVADNFVNQYNEMVAKLIPEDSNIQAHRFDFLGRGFKDSGRALHTVPDSELGKGILALKKVMQENGRLTVPYKIAWHLLNNPQDRKLVMRSEFMNTDGFEAVTVKNRKVLGLYNSSKGSGGPKASLSDVQYLGDILKKSNFTPARAYAVGGVRIQSFSDYIPRLVFDYLQMMADLSAKKLPAHAYTKEEMFALQFGMTGVKVNMSLVPAVDPDGVAPGLDADGNYTWYDGQSFGSDVNVKGSGQTGFERAVEIQNAAGYSANCGTIAVGISDEHIWKMLDDERIRMVIPYHKSSLNHIVAVLNNIDKYTDYTSVQNTRSKATGSKIEGKDFNFNDALRRLGDAKAAASAYLEWCEENEYIPKFDRFADHENYYKLLEDFATYDNGKAAPQGAVTMTFPGKDAAFGSMTELIERGLEEDAILEGRRQADVPKIVDKIEAVYHEGGMENGAKFSLKDDGKLERENARLKEVNQNLRDQFKRTKFAKVDRKSLDAFTKKLLKDYKSGADINDVREALDALYTYMASDKTDKPVEWEELQRRAYTIAESVLTGATELDTELYDEFKALREYLRTTAIAVEKNADLGAYDTLEEFRRAYSGRLYIANDGKPVDQVYQELSEQYPGFFDEADTFSQDEKLTRIAEVLDSLQPVERSRYAYDLRNHATWLANDILERIFDLPQAKPTYADKAAQKLYDKVTAERMASGRELAEQKRLSRETIQAKNARIRELIEEKRKEVKNAETIGRAEREVAVEKLREKFKDKEAKASETRRSSGLRGRIERHAAEMSQKLLKPDDKHHVPQELRAPVAALLDAINLESQYTIDPETGKRVKNGGGDPVKRSQAFNNLRVAYQKIIEEDSADIVVDPAITAMLDRVSELREVKLAEMSYSELETIWQVLRVVEHTVNNAGKLLSQEKYERTTEWAEAFVDDTETRRTKRGGKLEGIRLDLENPYTFFDHYGDAGHAVYRMLRDAQDKQQIMTGNVAEAVEKIVDPKTVRKLEKEVHEIKTERGVKLVLTKAQIMDIYLLTKRQQAQEHLMQGGIVQPEVESRHIKRGTDAVLLSYNDLQAIVGKMTVEDRKIAIRLQELTKTTLANYGNAASLKAYGYKKFTGEDYWPIKSAKEGVHSNVEKGAGNTRSIKNIGLAKTVMPHANNPLDIGGIFKTFASHSADMIDYAAWLCPMEDANRLFNFQFRDEGGLRTGKTIKGLLDRYGGKGAQEYWHRLMEDIQNGIKTQSDNNLMKPIEKVIGNVRGASVGANLRVIIQQPTAILRAAAVLSPADMAAGLVGGGGWKAALRHSAIAQRKDMGGFDISSPAQMQEILFDSKTKLARFNEAMMWGAGKADAATWGRIWSACEAAVKRKNKDLKPKSEAFYEAVDALFTEVIDQTQVVDGVLQRSQAMRSSNALLNQATAFMGEPTMAMNMLLRAYDGLVGEQDSKKRGAALRKFGRAATVLLVTNTVNALAQSIIDAARDDEDEEYWNKFWTAFSGLSGEEESAWQKAVAFVFGGNLGSSINPATYVPFAKDFISILSGYDVTRADADAMKDIVDAFLMLYESVAGNKKRTVGYAVKNLAQQGGKVFGISAPNILRDVWGITRTIALETDNIPLQYEMEKAIYNIEGEGNVSRFVDILYKAYTEDQAAYRHIYADLKSGGFDMSKIKEAMEERMKKAQGVTKVDDLDQRYLTPEQQTAYDKKVKSISKSDLWKSAKTSQRDELKGSLYDLTVMNSDGEKLKEKIDEGRGYGIDETEYLLYSMALDMADTPNKHGKLGGSPTNAEKADAISMVGGLSDSEIAFLWNTEQGYEAYAAGIDMKVYVDVLGEGGSVNVEKLVDAKAYDISEEAYFDFLDSLKEHDQPSESGKLGTFTQAEATAAIAAMPGLTDAQRAYLWQSVDKRWKENKNPWR